MDFRKILAAVDPANTGFVTFDAFMRFMSQQASGSEPAEQLIDAFRTLANEQVGFSKHASFSWGRGWLICRICLVLVHSLL